MSAAAVEPRDVDLRDGLTGDGIGEDSDAGDSNGEEDDDDEESKDGEGKEEGEADMAGSGGGTDGIGGSGLQEKHHRTRMPSWLQVAFKSALSSPLLCTTKTTFKVSVKLYKTFWLPTRASYF